jgi:hypothetical protein
VPITIKFKNERRARMSVMEEQYKGHVIQVTTEKDDSAYPWKPICRILDGASRELIKQIDWQIGYDTPDQAEKAGMLISKKWIHAKKPKL